MQTRFHSAIESVSGTAIGFAIALAGQVFITNYYNVQTTFDQDFRMTCFFTVLSIIRGYTVRRAFNRIFSK